MRNEGQYYADDTRTAPATPSSTEFADEAYGGVLSMTDLHAVLICLAVALVAASIGFLIASAWARSRPQLQDEIVADLDKYLKAQATKALAAYGPATIPAREEFVAAIQNALGPLLAFTDSLSDGLKLAAEAKKGTVKVTTSSSPQACPPSCRCGMCASSSASAASGPTTVVVQQHFSLPGAAADGGASPAQASPAGRAAAPPAPQPAATDRSMTAAEQTEASRRAIEKLAEAVKSDAFKPKLKAASNVFWQQRRLAPATFPKPRH